MMLPNYIPKEDELHSQFRALEVYNLFLTSGDWMVCAYFTKAR